MKSCVPAAGNAPKFARGVIEIHPDDRELFVFCRNHDDPKKSKEVCKVACIGCGICARKSDGSVVMKEFLAEIDYAKLDMSKIPLDKCSTGAIRLLDKVKVLPQTAEQTKTIN